MGIDTVPLDPNNFDLVYDAAGCYAKAVIRILVRLRNKEIRPLNICGSYRKEFFPNCIRIEDSVNAESILLDDKDVPLNFDTKTVCTCHNCDKEAFTFLEIVRLPISGWLLRIMCN